MIKPIIHSAESICNDSKLKNLYRELFLYMLKNGTMKIEDLISLYVHFCMKCFADKFEYIDREVDILFEELIDSWEWS